MPIKSESTYRYMCSEKSLPGRSLILIAKNITNRAGRKLWKMAQDLGRVCSEGLSGRSIRIE